MPGRDPNAHGVSTPALLRLSASAAVMNAVVPLALCLQVALAGKMAGSSVQAAFGLVTVTCGMGTTVFNFLVDGVVAKVGTAIGARRWDEARGRVRAALAAALLCGGTATAVLLTLRTSLFVLFGANQAVTARARAYYTFRASGIPLQCVASSANGCLGGYGRVHAATLLSTGRACLEVAGVVAALALDGTQGAMVGMGIVYVACVAMHATIGVALVACLVPDGARSRLGIFRGVFGGGPNPREDGYVEAPDASDGTHARSHSSSVLADLADFAVDGASMLIRSVLLQGSFFAAMACASRKLGVSGLAAHHVVTQLWMCSAYLVDGVATAGTVSGSRLVGAAMMKRVPRRTGGYEGIGPDTGPDETDEFEDAEPSPTNVSIHAEILASLRSVCARLLLLAFIAGTAICLGFVSFRTALVHAFTSDETVAAALLDEKLWRLLALSQPLNAVVFCLDGLVYAFQDFGFVREVFEVGVGYVFAPTLAWAYGQTPSTLANIWTAKVALNVWRLVAIGARIGGWCLTRRGLRGACERRRGGGVEPGVDAREGREGREGRGRGGRGETSRGDWSIGDDTDTDGGGGGRRSPPIEIDESAAAEEGDASPVTSADGSLRHWRMHAPAAARSP